MANISYIRILNAIESFSKEHLQVKRFASDFPAEMPNFATDTESFPILFVSPISSIFDMNITTFTIDVYCFDIIQKDRANINTILSDTNLILSDFNRWILDADPYGFDIIDISPTAEPIDNSLLDYAAGWKMSVTLVAETYGVCEIPFNNMPVIVNEINNIIYTHYITEAPIDGLIYGRKDADWVPVTTSTTGNYVPYIGATQAVNLGEFGLLTGNVEFDTTPTNVPTTPGSLYWNNTDGTLDLKLKGGNVTLQVGQETVVRVVNKTATNISLLEENYQAVRLTGAQGQRLKVDLAIATSDLTSAETIGLVTETILNNQQGFVTTSGLIRGVNTTGSLQGESWADGDVLYLSPITAGNITKVEPVAPQHLVIIGYVVNAHITQGIIFVKVDNGYELDELHNVSAIAPNNNEALVYEASTALWKNKTIPTALGYTPVSESDAFLYACSF